MTHYASLSLPHRPPPQADTAREANGLMFYAQLLSLPVAPRNMQSPAVSRSQPTFAGRTRTRFPVSFRSDACDERREKPCPQATLRGDMSASEDAKEEAATYTKREARSSIAKAINKLINGLAAMEEVCRADFKRCKHVMGERSLLQIN